MVGFPIGNSPMEALMKFSFFLFFLASTSVFAQTNNIGTGAVGLGTQPAGIGVGDSVFLPYGPGGAFAQSGMGGMTPENKEKLQKEIYKETKKMYDELGCKNCNLSEDQKKSLIEAQAKFTFDELTNPSTMGLSAIDKYHMLGMGSYGMGNNPYANYPSGMTPYDLSVGLSGCDLSSNGQEISCPDGRVFTLTNKTIQSPRSFGKGDGDSPFMEDRKPGKGIGSSRRE
jgi:hypothetical protein